MLAIGAGSASAPRGTNPRRASSDLLTGVSSAQRGSQAEPHLAIAPDDPDHLVAGWQENRYVQGSAEAHAIAVSRNGGKRWKDALLPELTVASGGTWQRAADPWLAFGSDGSVHYASLVGLDDTVGTNAIVVSRSIDGGDSWGSPIEITRSENPDFNDKPALTADVVDGSAHRGNVYVAWDVNVYDAPSASFVRQDLYLARSTDGGASYGAPQLVRSGAIAGGVIPRVGRKGIVYLLWTGEGSISRYALYFARSNNGGRTFTGAKVIDDLIGASVDGVRDGFSLPSFAVDPERGVLAVAWQDSRWDDRPAIALMVSEDRGKSWSAARRVSPDGDVPAFTPAVAFNADGDLAVGYYTFADTTSGSAATDLYLRISKDTGGTFAEPVRMTRRSFDLSLAADSSRGRFLGDYLGLVGGPRHFHALWVGTRRGESDVWTARTR